MKQTLISLVGLGSIATVSALTLPQRKAASLNQGLPQRHFAPAPQQQSKAPTSSSTSLHLFENIDFNFWGGIGVALWFFSQKKSTPNPESDESLLATTQSLPLNEIDFPQLKSLEVVQNVPEEPLKGTTRLVLEDVKRDDTFSDSLAFDTRTDSSSFQTAPWRAPDTDYLDGFVLPNSNVAQGITRDETLAAKSTFNAPRTLDLSPGPSYFESMSNTQPNSSGARDSPSAASYLDALSNGSKPFVKPSTYSVSKANKSSRSSPSMGVSYLESMSERQESVDYSRQPPDDAVFQRDYQPQSYSGSYLDGIASGSMPSVKPSSYAPTKSSFSSKPFMGSSYLERMSRGSEEAGLTQQDASTFVADPREARSETFMPSFARQKKSVDGPTSYAPTVLGKKFTTRSAMGNSYFDSMSSVTTKDRSLDTVPNMSSLISELQRKVAEEESAQEESRAGQTEFSFGTESSVGNVAVEADLRAKPKSYAPTQMGRSFQSKPTMGTSYFESLTTANSKESFGSSPAVMISESSAQSTTDDAVLRSEANSGKRIAAGWYPDTIEGTTAPFSQVSPFSVPNAAEFYYEGTSALDPVQGVFEQGEQQDTGNSYGSYLDSISRGTETKAKASSYAPTKFSKVAAPNVGISSSYLDFSSSSSVTEVESQQLPPDAFDAHVGGESTKTLFESEATQSSTSASTGSYLDAIGGGAPKAFVKPSSYAPTKPAAMKVAKPGFGGSYLESLPADENAGQSYDPIEEIPTYAKQAEPQAPTFGAGFDLPKNYMTGYSSSISEEFNRQPSSDVAFHEGYISDAYDSLMYANTMTTESKLETEIMNAGTAGSESSLGGGSYLEAISGKQKPFVKPSSYAPTKASSVGVAKSPFSGSYLDNIQGGLATDSYEPTFSEDQYYHSEFSGEQPELTPSTFSSSDQYSWEQMDSGKDMESIPLNSEAYVSYWDAMGKSTSATVPASYTPAKILTTSKPSMGVSYLDELAMENGESVSVVENPPVSVLKEVNGYGIQGGYSDDEELAKFLYSFHGDSSTDESNLVAIQNGNATPKKSYAPTNRSW